MTPLCREMSYQSSLGECSDNAKAEINYSITSLPIVNARPFAILSVGRDDLYFFLKKRARYFKRRGHIWLKNFAAHLKNLYIPLTVKLWYMHVFRHYIFIFSFSVLIARNNLEITYNSMGCSYTKDIYSGVTERKNYRHSLSLGICPFYLRSAVWRLTVVIWKFHPNWS